MKNALFTPTLEYTSQDITNYLNMLKDNPFKIVMLIIDIAIVLFLAIKLIHIIRETRAWQLIKGIVLLTTAEFFSLGIAQRITNDAIQTAPIIFLILLTFL